MLSKILLYNNFHPEQVCLAKYRVHG